MGDLKKLDTFSNRIKDKDDHDELLQLVDEKVISYSADGRIISFSVGENQFIDYVIMGDEYFYHNWLTQFAIGTVAGRNYFDMTTWSEITDKFTKGVIVVHEQTKDFLFLIPKFIEPNYDATAMAVITRLSRKAGNGKNQSKENATKTVSVFAKLFTEITNRQKAHDGVTDLVPDRIYKMFNVNPKVLKDVIYIRDHFKTIGTSDEAGDEATRIITKNYNGEKVTQKEKEFIWSLTNNQYIFADGAIVKEETVKQTDDKPKHVPKFDPFSD